MNFVAASAVESSTFWKDFTLEAIAAGPEAAYSLSEKNWCSERRGVIALVGGADGVDQERREVDFLTGKTEVLALALRIISYRLTLSPTQLLRAVF